MFYNNQYTSNDLKQSKIFKILLTCKTRNCKLTYLDNLKIRNILEKSEN